MVGDIEAIWCTYLSDHGKGFSTQQTLLSLIENRKKYLTRIVLEELC